jgi:glycosyltransferase involved in cell wall biosynthesis
MYKKSIMVLLGDVRKGINLPMVQRLMVIVSGSLNSIIRKGELTDRYYNPGEFFDEVHLVMTNNETVFPSDLQKTVGRAELHVHNLPLSPRLFLRTLGYTPFFFDLWARLGIRLASQIRPNLIRCYGNTFNAFLAAEIKRALGVPVVVSLHTHAEESRRIAGLKWWSPTGFVSALRSYRHRTLERIALKTADCVIAVCESYKKHALRYGASRVEVIPNIVNPTHLHRKNSYVLHSPPRVISVGRQIAGKNPINLIRAVKDLPLLLVLVGDGEVHEHLRKIAEDCGTQGKVTFLRAVANDELCEMLSDFDIFAAHCSYSGIPKTVIEALLTGLPVVLNRERGATPELDGDWVLTTDNTSHGYREALLALIEKHERRAALGRRGYEYAREHFTPAEVERRVVDLYREVMLRNKLNGTTESKPNAT